MIYIGIDTGTNTGYAEWDSKKGRLLEVDSLPIHKAMERVKPMRIKKRLLAKSWFVSGWKIRGKETGSALKE